MSVTGTDLFLGLLAVLSYMVLRAPHVRQRDESLLVAGISFPTLIITIPSTVIVLIWLCSLYGSKFTNQHSVAICTGFISCSSAWHKRLFPGAALNRHHAACHLFVVGHFHLYGGRGHLRNLRWNLFWFPKMTGRMMHEGMGKLHFWLTFVGHIASLCRFIIWGSRATCAATRPSSTITSSRSSVHRFITVAALPHRPCPVHFPV